MTRLHILQRLLDAWDDRGARRHRHDELALQRHPPAPGREGPPVTVIGAPYPPVDGSQPCREVDPDVFFPRQGGAGLGSFALRTAVSLCDSCAFVAPCLDYALTHRVSGIWGGTTELSRRQTRLAYGIEATEPGSGLDALLGISA